MGSTYFSVANLAPVTWSFRLDFYSDQNEPKLQCLEKKKKHRVHLYLLWLTTSTFSAHLHMCQMSNAGRLWKEISVPQHKQDETIIVLKHFFPSLQI